MREKAKEKGGRDMDRGGMQSELLARGGREEGGEGRGERKKNLKEKKAVTFT